MDTPALRIATSNQLSHLTLEPAGLSPSAVLIIDKVMDPLPGRLRTRQPSIGIDRVWENAVREVMTEKYHRAGRPRRGRINGTPEAVLFSDASEMVACHIVDIAEGNAQRWWWRMLTQPDLRDVSTAIRVLAVENPDEIPAVLTQLSEWRRASRVAAVLRPGDAAIIGTIMLNHFGLARLARVVFEPGDGAPLDRQRAATESSDDQGSFGPGGKPQRLFEEILPQDDQEDAGSPWDAWVTPEELSANADASITALFGLAVVLQKRPHVVRRSSFVRSSARWVRYNRAQEAWGDGRSLRQSDGVRRHDASMSIKKDSLAQPDTRRRISFLDKAAASTMAAESLAIDVPGDKENITSGMTRSREEDSNAALETTFIGDCISTRIGGLFYLINLMDALDLPHCLMPEWMLTEEMSRWALLDCLARGLLGPRFYMVQSDPVWTLLAALDNREPANPIADIETEGDEFNLPSDWMAVAHPGNMVDLSTDMAPALQARGIPERLSRLLCQLVPVLRQILSTLLVANGTEPDVFVDRLFPVAGTVYVTATHIDWVTDIDNISIEIRKAGLDRDPGWLPEWGRVVKFHFD